MYMMYVCNVCNVCDVCDVCDSVCMYACLYVCVCVCVCKCIFICICICMYIFFVYIEREREGVECGSRNCYDWSWNVHIPNPSERVCIIFLRTRCIRGFTRSHKKNAKHQKRVETYQQMRELRENCLHASTPSAPKT
jgi:hypothetical protein